MTYHFRYKPDGETLRAFMRDDSFVRLLRGPIGSGKSVSCAVELYRRALEQAPGEDGIRRTRFAVIRNTNPELKTTTIKTWLEWFPEDVFGKFNWSPPYTHRIRMPGPGNTQIDMEVIFLALDRPEDVKKLLSLELTGAWVNEAREIPKAVIDGVTSRVDRYPSMKDGGKGATFAFVICDTNAPDEDHWWPIMSGEAPVPEWMTDENRLTMVKPANWKFFSQPGAMLPKLGPDRRTVIGWEINPKRENQAGVKAAYYANLIQGKSTAWIKIMVGNQLGALVDGKPVYPTFRREAHVAVVPIDFDLSLDLYVGLDFGLNPAAIFGQKTRAGAVRVLRELYAANMGSVRFAKRLIRFLADEFPDLDTEHHLKLWGDPSGDNRAGTDEISHLQIFRKAGLFVRPANTNDPVVRIEAVASLLDGMTDGYPSLMIDPGCKMLIGGFEHGYHYRRLQVSGTEKHDTAPDKNAYSHPHDALQYKILGMGFGRKVLGGGDKQKPKTAKSAFSVFDRTTSRVRSVGLARRFR